MRNEPIAITIGLFLMGTSFASSNTMIAVLNYHDIVTNNSQVNQYTITTTELTNQLNWLKQNNYQTINMNKLVQYMKNGTHIPTNTVVIVFDDGYTSQATIAAPLLNSYGYVATFCAIEQGMFNASWSGPGGVGTGNNLRFNLSRALYMQNIYGDEICGHTYSHWDLTYPSQNPEGQKANWTLQLNVSTQVFRSNGLNITDFTPPYCDYNQSTITWIQKLGYLGMKTCMNNFGTFKKPTHDPRFNYDSGSIWGITTIEPNASLANITLFGRIVTCGNLSACTGSSTTTSTTTSISSTSTTSTSTIPIGNCSGTLGLNLAPNPAKKNSKISAIATGLSNCNAIVSIKTYEGCTTGTTLITYPYGSSGNFLSPNGKGNYGYWACVSGKAIKATLKVS
jgi:peptidoglycan/xylan/chitin deacetylase (PgdA/CDA1 family)